MGKHFKQPVSDAGSDAAGSDATELLDGAADVTRRMSGAEGGAADDGGGCPENPAAVRCRRWERPGRVRRCRGRDGADAVRRSRGRGARGFRRGHC